MGVEHVRAPRPDAHERETLMHGSVVRRGAAALVLSAIALGAVAAPVAAAAPTVDTWANHVERPYLSCDGFDAIGVWDISHTLTTWSTNGGSRNGTRSALNSAARSSTR